MSDEELKQLLGESVDSIKPKLAALGPADLARLDELEREAKNRATLLNAIEDVMLEQQYADSRSDSGAASTSDDEASLGGGTDAAKEVSAQPTKEARGEEVPAYQKPDYNGPLSGEQAMWRNANLQWKDGKLVRK